MSLLSGKLTIRQWNNAKGIEHLGSTFIIQQDKDRVSKSTYSELKKSGRTSHKYDRAITTTFNTQYITDAKLILTFEE